MTTMEMNKDVEHIRRDIASLRADVASLATSLKQVAAERGKETLGRIEDLGERTWGKAEDLRRGAEREIATHPFASVLASLGLGILLGAAIDPKCRSRGATGPPA